MKLLIMLNTSHLIKNQRKREETEDILIKCIHIKYKTWQVLKFGSDAQGISNLFSDLDFAIISEELKNLLYEMKLKI